MPRYFHYWSILGAFESISRIFPFFFIWTFRCNTFVSGQRGNCWLQMLQLYFSNVIVIGQVGHENSFNISNCVSVGITIRTFSLGKNIFQPIVVKS